MADLIPTRWLNAIIARLFLGVKGTTVVEGWVIGRLMKKRYQFLHLNAWPQVAATVPCPPSQLHNAADYTKHIPIRATYSRSTYQAQE
ncbi:hypothetical protein M422DRAFT_263894 [Sphaerobolus stellatus SS14]|uniref:Uncharacterized protein n=1 Tax=Sphaerobolus stellatus (strain SS14) TaxID=990650 RepID=A0A0C9V9E2_SPHS4|nr:hypothetical protein M422DRAFT_263894 [Sphaerobolus stellatus SS14]